MIRRHIFYYHYFVPEEKPLLDTVVQKRVFSNVTYLMAVSPQGNEYSRASRSIVRQVYSVVFFFELKSGHFT